MAPREQYPSYPHFEHIEPEGDTLEDPLGSGEEVIDEEDDVEDDVEDEVLRLGDFLDTLTIV